MTVNHPDQPSAGLMAFWADIDEDYLLRFQQWHNCEHIPERVSIPGFDRGKRYRDIDGKLHFLMFYETQSSSVLGSEAYLAALNNPTPWTKESLTHFRNPVRNIYELIGSSGTTSPFVSPYLLTLRFNLATADEPIRLPVYSGDWLDMLTAQNTVTRARLYRVDEDISAIMTSERKIYGGGPGQQRYVAFIELSEPFKFDDDPVESIDDRLFAGNTGRTDEFEDRLWLEICHVSPKSIGEHSASG